MGHLINPIGFRLGHCLSWEDKWYVKSIYYPEFLHSVLNIRSYLYFFFNKKKIERMGLLYSHFEIVKLGKNFIIKILFYHSRFELLTDTFLFDNNLEFKGFLRSNFYFHTHLENGKYKWDPTLSFSFMLLLIFWCFFLDLFETKSINERVKSKVLLSLNLKNKIYSKWRFIKNKKNLKFFLLKKKEFLSKKKKFNFYESDYELRNEALKKEEIKDLHDYPKVYMLFEVLYFLTEIKYINQKFFFKNLNRFFLAERNNNYFLSSRKKYKFLFFCSLLKKIGNKIKSLMLKPVLSHRYIVEFWLNLLLNYKFISPALSFITWFLLIIFKQLTVLDNIKIKWFIISNVNINAKFLAKYMARKLKRHFTVFQVVNPLKKELIKLFVKRRSTSILNLFKFNLRRNNLKTFYKGLFKRLFFILKAISNKENFKFFNFNKTFYSFQYLFITFNLNIKNLSRLQLFNIFYFYNKYESLLQYFYNKNFYNQIFLSMFWIKKNFNLKDSLNVLFIFDHSLKRFYNSINFIMFETKSFFFNSKLLITTFYALKNIIRYNYFVLNYKFFLKHNNINISKLRKKKDLRSASYLYGYKMAFYGRFTRKQRAASIWFKSGKVPLNSVNCRMDYAFYTVPLKNSAVSVKVWLYKTPLVYDWVYKVPEYEAIS